MTSNSDAQSSGNEPPLSEVDVVESRDGGAILGRRYQPEGWDNDTFRIFVEEVDDVIEQLGEIRDDR